MSRATIEGSGYYDFTGKTKVVDGVTVRQIVATRDFGDYEKGTVGGYIQSRHNLLGGSWVKGNAVVMENATLDQGAFAGGSARVKGNSRVFGSVAIIHEGEVSGDSVITAEVELDEGAAIVIAVTSAVRDATISVVKGGHVGIAGSALVSDGATLIGGNILVTGKSVVKEDSLVKGVVDIEGNACVCGGAQVVGDGEGITIDGDEHISELFYRRG